MTPSETSRKICYISGTRADFGLMRFTLEAIHHHSFLDLAIVATGMHLSGKYGNTVDEIKASGLPLAALIAVDLEPTTGATMARNIGKMLVGFVDVFAKIKPDIVLLLGDRGEMLAGAIAAIHLNIPIAHIHGGERSGTVDEPVRHAISKLSHFHFAATEKAGHTLLRMGEATDRVYVTGAPGLDGLVSLASLKREELCADVRFDPRKPVALLVHHPVLQQASASGNEMNLILDALKRRDIQVIALKPNADAGSESIRRALDERKDKNGMRVVTHFAREKFVSWMAASDFMIGNSSAGIIEAASFGTPVVNVGSRQLLRERNANVIDAAAELNTIENAIGEALGRGRSEPGNVYGDGQTAERIVSLLTRVDLSTRALSKTNAF